MISERMWTMASAPISIFRDGVLVCETKAIHLNEKKEFNFKPSTDIQKGDEVLVTGNSDKEKITKIENVFAHGEVLYISALY